MPGEMRTIPPPSTCPVCGLDPDKATAHRLVPELVQAVYTCPLEHIWQMRWLIPNEEVA